MYNHNQSKVAWGLLTATCVFPILSASKFHGFRCTACWLAHVTLLVKSQVLYIATSVEYAGKGTFVVVFPMCMESERLMHS